MSARARLRRAATALAAACVLGLAAPAGAQEVGIAARVNGAEISVFRLERHFEDYLRLQGRNVAAIRNPEVFKRLRREALDQLIDKELLWQHAQRRGIVVADADLRQAREAIAAGYADRDAFRRRLQQAGFDDAGYDAYLRRELAARRALAELIGSVTVSDEEVERTLAREPAPAGMDTGAAQQQVRDYLAARRRAEAARAALQQLRATAGIELLQRY